LPQHCFSSFSLAGHLQRPSVLVEILTTTFQAFGAARANVKVYAKIAVGTKLDTKQEFHLCSKCATGVLLSFFQIVPKLMPSLQCSFCVPQLQTR
jgi:hypothetical protein